MSFIFQNYLQMAWKIASFGPYIFLTRGAHDQTDADFAEGPPERCRNRSQAPMTPIERENHERRAIEALAQALYESEDPGRIAWSKRAAIVREPWIARARQQLAAARRSDESVDSGST